MGKKSAFLNASHWGVFQASPDGKGGISVEPYPGDAEPSQLLANLPGALRHPARIASPTIRKGWLSRPFQPAKRDGTDEFVQVSWDTALDAVAGRLNEVRAQGGNEAIFGGSYGWGSAGRFHHAQSQIHRFLNCIGGYTYSVNSYSVGTAQVLLPHVVADIDEILRRATSWPIIERETELFLLFGGMAEKNLSVAAGGVSRHQVKSHLRAARENGAEFHLVSPQRSDLMKDCDAVWYPVYPGTDTAFMLALAYVLVKSGGADEAFLDKYCTGYERLRDYVLGRGDGVEKSPAWAEPLTGIAAARIESLARMLPEKRTLINISWSLQRAPYGEQPLWMGIALAAMLGQIGLPGGGFSHAYGASDEIGRPLTRASLPTLQQGSNPIETFIPVARFSDMLLQPGAQYEYNGQQLRYPHISLVFWAGGNPFHHQQDLFKLERALRRVPTIVVNEPFWTAMARRADIVLPTTLTVERNDIFAARNDPSIVAMKQVVPPFADAMHDYDIFSALADRLGVALQFTEGRGEMQWLEELYESWRASSGLNEVLPAFAKFWEQGDILFKPEREDYVMLSAFRADPAANPLPTPSGRIEIYSETIAGFGYEDCPGHPVWFEPEYRQAIAGSEDKRFIVIANNPGTRLHSQLDVGGVSQQAKVQGREPIRICPSDAEALGVKDGDVVLVWNEIGACLAGVRVDDDVLQGIVQLATGAWFDAMELPQVGRICIHGNPNVLIPDRGTSRLSQGPSAQYAVVSLRKWDQELPAKRVDRAPAMGRLHDGAAGA